MKYILIHLFFLLGTCNVSNDLLVQEFESRQSVSPVDHSVFDNLLRTYVNQEGFVDYKGWKKDKIKLDEYLVYLGNHKPSSSWDKKSTLAYYINLYNAAAVQLILDNNMPESIKDIGGTFNSVWNKEYISIKGEKYSLNDIEKGILLKMGDPRVHFAINCASYSCPKLQNRAFTKDNLEELMEKGAREFINSSKNDISRDKVSLSKIFKWYKEDFTSKELGLIDYLNKYSTVKINKNASIDYKDYNWKLNKQ